VIADAHCPDPGWNLRVPVVELRNRPTRVQACAFEPEAATVRLRRVAHRGQDEDPCCAAAPRAHPRRRLDRNLSRPARAAAARRGQAHEPARGRAGTTPVAELRGRSRDSSTSLAAAFSITAAAGEFVRLEAHWSQASARRSAAAAAGSAPPTRKPEVVRSTSASACARPVQNGAHSTPAIFLPGLPGLPGCAR
jgi:hypothetical protein